MTKLTFGEWLEGDVAQNIIRTPPPQVGSAYNARGLHIASMNVLYERYKGYLEQPEEPKPFPQEGDEYYCLTDSGISQARNWTKGYPFVMFKERGNVYQTQAEAELADKKRIARATIERWAKERNGDWKPDWSDEYQIKYTVIYGHMSKTLQVDGTVYVHQNISEVYYKDGEISKLAIEELAEEYKLLMDVED